MKVAFATLGCRVNVYESEAMAEKFIREGYEVVDFNEFSDVYVIILVQLLIWEIKNLDR